jgi:protein gp37
LKSKKPKIIFMDSMSDIADWELEWKFEVRSAISANPQHTYLFLTKRPEDCIFIKGKNIWNGVSVTRWDEFQRIDDLYWSCGGENDNLFVSFEPLQEPITAIRLLEIGRFGWAIIGAETGNRKGKFVPTKKDMLGLVYALRGLKVPTYMKDSCVPIVGEENMLREFPEGLKKR